MSDQPPNTARKLEDYLDGLIPEPQRAATELELSRDARASGDLKLQRDIDSSLQRLFERSDASAAHGAPVDAVAGRIGGGQSYRMWTLLAAAAVLLLAFAGVYFGMDAFSPRPDRLGDLYHAELAAGFQPQEVCTGDAEFAAWVQQHYGEALRPASHPSEIQLVGWSYGVGVTSYSGVLLAKVQDKPVMVVVDQAKNEGRTLRAPEDSSLRMFRRTIGSLVLYEVTPLDHASVLPTLEQAGK